MMMPSIFGENLFDNWMDFPFEDEFFGKKNPLYGKHEKNLMKTDVRETKDGYEVDVDLPGFKKDNISAQLQDGYLPFLPAKVSIRMNRKKTEPTSAKSATAAA